MNLKKIREEIDQEIAKKTKKILGKKDAVRQSVILPLLTEDGEKFKQLIKKYKRHPRIELVVAMKELLKKHMIEILIYPKPPYSETIIKQRGEIVYRGV